MSDGNNPLNIINQQDEEQKKKAAAMGKTQQQAPVVPGATATPDAGAAMPGGQGSPSLVGQGPIAAQQARTTGKTGSGFVNLQNVLAANRQNRMGQAVRAGVGGMAQGVRQQIGGAEQKFREGVEAGKVGTAKDIGAAQNVLSNIQGYAGETPTDLVSDEQAREFARQMAGQYTGPSTLGDTSTLQSQIERAKQLGQSIGTAGGRQNLLQTFVGGRGYSTGKQALDTALLGLTAGKTLQEAKRQTLGLGQQLSQAEAGAAGAAQTAAEQSKSYGQQLKALLGAADTGTPVSEQTKDLVGQSTGLIGKAYSDIVKQQAERQKAANETFEALKARAEKNELTQEDVEKYILPLTGGEQLLGGDITSMLSGLKASQFTPEDVASASQLAKLNALQKLAGTKAVTLDPTKLGKQTESIIQAPEQAGQFEEIRKQQSELSQQMTPLQKQKAITEQLVSSSLPILQQLQANIASATAPVMFGQPQTDTNKIVSALESAINNPNLPTEVKNKLQQQLNIYFPKDNRMYWGPKPDFSLEGLLQSTGVAALQQKQRDLEKKLSGLTTQAGSKGSILASMSPEERIKYEAAHPLTLSKSDWADYYAPPSITKSDIRSKTNIKNGDKHVESFLDKISPYQYEYNSPEDGLGKHLGVMAQDLEKTIEGRSAVDEISGKKHVNFGKLSGMMLASQANLHKRLKELEKNKK